MCLEKQRGIFHPNNINHVKILDLAFESAIKMEQWKESLKYGILLIEGYRYVIKLKCFHKPNSISFVTVDNW